jgi:hypothetical protein
MNYDFDMKSNNKQILRTAPLYAAVRLFSAQLAEL